MVDKCQCQDQNSSAVNLYQLYSQCPQLNRTLIFPNIWRWAITGQRKSLYAIFLATMIASVLNTLSYKRSNFSVLGITMRWPHNL